MEVFGMDVKVDAATARIISPSIAAECADAGDNIFSNETYLASIISRKIDKSILSCASQLYINMYYSQVGMNFIE